MRWLLWRQHRSQALVAAVALGLFALAVALTGVHMANIYRDSVANCADPRTCRVLGGLFNGYGAIVDTVHLTLSLPLLLGTFLGATLVARETEHATNVLVWTQSITRRRWVRDKFAMAIVASLLVSAVVSALVTWWSGTPNTLGGNRFQGAQFDTQNITPVAFALFGVALGIAAGAVLRRTLPALATTVVLYVAVRIMVAVYLRPHYSTAERRVGRISDETPLPSGSWSLRRTVVDPSGHTVGTRLNVPTSCRSVASRVDVASCLDRLGYRNVVTYHPASEYWRYQLIESSIFVALAVVLIGVGVVVTRRHDA